MKHLYSLLFTILISGLSTGQTIWNSGSLTFTKADGADFTLPINQDQITPTVALTRGNNQGLYNIAQEATYTDFVSPADTEWALGTTANIANLTFQSWEDTVGSTPPNYVGQQAVVHLISDDIYIDITFNSWASGRNGGQGGFSYTRATGPTGSVSGVENNVSLYPNPASNLLFIASDVQDQNFSILNISGQVVLSGALSENQSINVEKLRSGLYFLEINQRRAKFIVE